MIVALLLQAAMVPPMPPQDWSALPVAPLPRAVLVLDGAAFVRAEVESGRCPPAPSHADGTRLVAPVAILIGPGGAVARIVPRAIGCITVEQYTVGYVQSLLRGGPDPTMTIAPGWYRLAVTYRW